MMRISFKSIFFILNEDEREAFSKSVTKQNSQRFVPVALLTILLEIIMLIRGVIIAPALDDGGLIYIYISLYAVMILISVAALLLYRAYSIQPAKYSDSFRRFICFIFCFGLLWAAAVTLLDFKETDQVTVFVSMQYMVGVIFLVPPAFSLIFQLSAEALFMLGLALYLPGSAELSGVFINTAISAVLAWVTSRLLYSGSLDEFRSNRVIDEKNRELAALSVTDPLTGLYNRRYMDKQLEKLLRSLSRTSGKMSVLLLDIDFFKKYNDTHGHTAGDDCLKEVPRVLSEIIKRSGDFVARYGGEEFIVVLPNTDEAGARAVAERMLMIMKNLSIPHRNSDTASYVTVSIGGATGSPEFDRDPYDYIKCADTALYTSKSDGRNRYTWKSLAVDKIASGH